MATGRKALGGARRGDFRFVARVRAFAIVMGHLSGHE